ncbi:adenylyl-sulfate kinase [Nonomuraea sp. NPDC049714]|uniref:adenylyl-sulfate kinase n=1 Tax=Nonomuraea sp. NPDC049714 TaxID=3364357 RepID=UPI003788C3E6
MVFWITGLSGAGKTAVARELSALLAADGHAPIVLDGDDLLEVLQAGDAYDRESRHRRAYTYARLCALLARQGHTVVMATIALFHDVHAWNRRNIAGYFEIYLDVPLDVLRERDTKGIYGGGGEVVGIDVQAQVPLRPDLVLPTHGPLTPAHAAARIYDLHLRKGHAT